MKKRVKRKAIKKTNSNLILITLSMLKEQGQNINRMGMMRKSEAFIVNFGTLLLTRKKIK